MGLVAPNAPRSTNPAGLCAQVNGGYGRVVGSSTVASRLCVLPAPAAAAAVPFSSLFPSSLSLPFVSSLLLFVLYPYLAVFLDLFFLSCYIFLLACALSFDSRPLRLLVLLPFRSVMICLKYLPYVSSLCTIRESASECREFRFLG